LPDCCSARRPVTLWMHSRCTETGEPGCTAGAWALVTQDAQQVHGDRRPCGCAAGDLEHRYHRHSFVGTSIFMCVLAHEERLGPTLPCPPHLVHPPQSATQLSHYDKWDLLLSTCMISRDHAQCHWVPSLEGMNLVSLGRVT